MYVFLQVFWICVFGASPVSGYFLGDTKAVLHGCNDHWTLQDRTAMPLLYRMTVCVDVRVVDPGAWVAFTYSSAHVPRPELGLEGDAGALYGWLLGVRHRFPVKLALGRWHSVCLRRDVPGNSFSLELDGRLVAERTVIAQAIPQSGSLWLGCRPRRQAPGAAFGRLEVYMFRMWADLARRVACEDGTVIGWDAQYWGVTSPRARQTDDGLPCAQTPELGHSFSPPPLLTSTMDTSEPLSVIAASSGHVDKPLPMTPPTTTLLTTTTSATVPVSPLAPPSSSSLTNQMLISTTVPTTESLTLADQTTPTTGPHPTSAEIPISLLAPPTIPSLTNQESSSSQAPPTRSFAPADQTSLIAAMNEDILTSTLVPPPSPSLANQESSSTQAPPTRSLAPADQTSLIAATNADVLTSTLVPPPSPSLANQESSSTQPPPTKSFAPADQTSLIAATNADVLTSTLVPPTSPSLANQESSSTQAPPTRSFAPADQTLLIAATNKDVLTSTLVPPTSPSLVNQGSSSTQAPPTAPQTTLKPLPLVVLTTTNEKVPASTLFPPFRLSSTNQVSSTTQAPPSTLSGGRHFIIKK
ncbi:mucin-2 [Nerophis ophidion]|uniref:mucin-2 n=1 Tax=Nerophis ophidion TaxID=159077 RepID=UPI002ADF0F1A|nr:mucin-2 [Nerophis ophidion]